MIWLEMWLEIGEAHFGRRWPLAYVTTLSGARAKTARKAGARRLWGRSRFNWVFGGITARRLHRTYARNTSREAVAGQAVPVSLLIRRIVVYLWLIWPTGSHLRTKGGRIMPRIVRNEGLGSWQEYHQL